MMFNQSLLNPAVTSGRNANCFFQSFIHVFTHLPADIHHQLLNDKACRVSIHYLVENFNKAYADLLPEPFDFEKIMELSKSLHPLDREILFGSVLRTTYNSLVEAKIIFTKPLGLAATDIVLADQTIAFANSFGAHLNVYMHMEEFAKLQEKMPDGKAESLLENTIEVDKTLFVCDSEKNQPQLWTLNLVFAGVHLNYTCGTPELNQVERDQVTISISNHGAQFASAPFNSQTAPLFSSETQESFAVKAEALFREVHLKNLMKKSDILGISTAVINSKGSISTMELGVTKEENPTLVTSKTVFGAASLSKPVFAYLVLKLIEKNKVNLNESELGKFFLPKHLTKFDLDTPLFQILPLEGLSKDPSDKTKAKLLTSRMVLLHVTGLPITHDDTKGSLKFQFQPNTEYGYSGVGFAYLQKVIEKLTQSNLEALAKKYLFIPLEMDQSTFIADANKPLDMQAANSLQTTASDFAKFTFACMHDQTLEHAFKPIVPMSVDHWAMKLKVPEDDLKYVAWGLSWGIQLDKQGNAMSAYHSGDMNAWRAWVAIDLKNKNAIVYFANSANGHMLAEHIIAAYVDLSHAFNCFFPKFGFARKVEDNWEDLQKQQFSKIGEYLESRNHPPKLFALLSAELGFFRKVEKEYLIENRGKSPESQQEYDKQFGVILKG